MPKPRTCQKCGSRDLKRRSTTYPLTLPGRQINVQRVKVNECSSCGHLMPTPEGEAKLQRCLQVFGEMLDNINK
ncbi:MAG: YgiT-type zinc finger protein [Steroidobacteraceae bacterium]